MISLDKKLGGGVPPAVFSVEDTNTVDPEIVFVNNIFDGQAGKITKNDNGSVKWRNNLLTGVSKTGLLSGGATCPGMKEAATSLVEREDGLFGVAAGSPA